jgi:hypothetical protein
MALFRCLIRGENFPGSLAGQSEAVGFYTTRYVEAPSLPEAELAAMALLRSDPNFELVRPEDRMEDAKIFFEQLEQVTEEVGFSPASGFSFFSMGT